MHRLEREVSLLRAELGARGLSVPPVSNPGAPPRLSDEARRLVDARRAAKARAAKPVGEGKGKVSSPAVATRLRRDLRDIEDT